MVRSERRLHPEAPTLAWLRLLAGLTGVGCADVLGLPDDVRPPEACASCRDRHCAAELAACRAQPSCGERLDCLDRCASADEGCRAACTRGEGIGTPADGALTRCQAIACGASCELSCGGVVGSHFSAYVGARDAGAACAQCLTDARLRDAGAPSGEVDGCEAAEACAVSPSCMSALGCSAACPQYDEGCRDACYAFVSTSSQDCERFHRWRNAIGLCPDECGAGRDWSCDEPWPRAVVSGQIDVAFQVSALDLADTFPPVEGARVRPCPTIECAEDRVSEVTDAAGRTLVRGASAPFNGHFLITHGDFPDHLVHRQPTLVSGSPVPMFTQETGRPCPPEGLEAVLMREADVGALLRLVDPAAAWDPTRGILVVDVVDCQKAGASGVVVELAAPCTSTHAMYFEGVLPVATRTATGPTGRWAAANVTPGACDVTARVNGTIVAWALALPVRAGVITRATLVPRPGQSPP